jgi:RNA polymerase sigma-70 factor (ECF subfamily)
MDLSNQAAFERVFADHRDGVHAAAYRVLGDAAQAQDVTQDVFLRLWLKPERYDASRGPVGAYLRLMARSRALDLWREGQAAGRAGDRIRAQAIEEESRPEERPAEALGREEDRREVSSALGTLPRNQQEALLLAYYGGLTADEIAARGGIPLGTAKSRLRLGLSKLRTELAPALVPTAA